jgi:predicted AAA+ superfamily ATPase
MVDLLLFNPWWESPVRIESDRSIVDYHESKLQWQPKIKKEFNLTEDAVYTLRGPRQVGKTTLIKLIASELLHAGVAPRAIFYYSCDLISNPEELFQVIRQYQEFSEALQFERRYVFIDEISLVPDWQNAVKQVIDLGWGRATTFILTGSSALDIKRGAERLPGRRGRVVQPDKVMMPLGFRDFIEKCSDIPIDFARFSLKVLLEEPSTIEILKSQIEVFLPRLSVLLERFLTVGGFPLAVESFLRERDLSEDVMNTYLSVIRSDFEKMKKSRILLRQVLVRILSLGGAPVSWQNLAKTIDTPSYNTVREYSELLADSFLLSIIYFLERNKKIANPHKGKKFYFFDPLILNLARQEAGLGAKHDVSLTVESAAAAHLVRTFERNLFEGFGSTENVFYWRSTKGKEVDFVVVEGELILPLEVKYQSMINRSDYSTMKRSFGKGILVTKGGFLQDGTIIGIPAPVFFLLDI